MKTKTSVKAGRASGDKQVKYLVVVMKEVIVS